MSVICPRAKECQKECKHKIPHKNYFISCGLVGDYGKCPPCVPVPPEKCGRCKGEGSIPSIVEGTQLIDGFLTCPNCHGTGYVLDGADGTLCQDDVHDKPEGWKPRRCDDCIHKCKGVCKADICGVYEANPTPSEVEQGAGEIENKRTISGEIESILHHYYENREFHFDHARRDLLSLFSFTFRAELTRLTQAATEKAREETIKVERQRVLKELGKKAYRLNGQINKGPAIVLLDEAQKIITGGK